MVTINSIRELSRAITLEIQFQTSKATHLKLSDTKIVFENVLNIVSPSITAYRSDPSIIGKNVSNISKITVKKLLEKFEPKSLLLEMNLKT